jgi:HAD superfamily hydrolase (TIGR01509 family)
MARAFVFDLDGTLVDNLRIHIEAFGTFLARRGLPPLSAENRRRIDGLRNSDIFPMLFGVSAAEALRMAEEKEALYRELSHGRLLPLPGLVRLLDALAAKGLPAAVATSAPAENVRHTLGELGLAARLPRIVRSDDVPRGKPHPDVFLEAARVLGAAPGECVAFEDAPAGIVAARTAGMTCVAVTTSFSAEALASHGAAPDYAVASYDEYLAGPGAWLLDP